MDDNLGMSCKRAGYEYRYRFGVNEDEIPNRNSIIDRYGASPERRVFFFEIRTNFMLKKRVDVEDEDLIGSEFFDMIAHESDDEVYLKIYLTTWMGFRLKEYWIMSDDEIEFMLSRTLDFAKRRAAADNRADNRDELVIPVVVDLDICTVQLERETIDEAYDRAIRAECLIPIHFLPNHSGRNLDLHFSIDGHLGRFLKDDLEKIRVEHVDQGLTLMEMCSICLREPTVGTQVSVLPCGHASHYHCIVRWFIKSNSCPLCRFPAHRFPVCNNFPFRG